jgi:hypothetical protein
LLLGEASSLLVQKSRAGQRPGQTREERRLTGGPEEGLEKVEDLIGAAESSLGEVSAGV